MPEQWQWVESLYQFEASEAPAPPSDFAPFSEREEPEVRVDLLAEDDERLDGMHLEIVDDADTDDQRGSGGEEPV
jgi:hypothetical protein